MKLTYAIRGARKLAPLFSLLLASGAMAQDFAIGSAFGSSPLRVYAVSASGEISLHHTAIGSTQTPRVAVDSGGRFAVTIIGPNDLNVFRIAHDRTLSIAASVEAGPDLRYDSDIALSPDGRLILASLRDVAQFETVGFGTFIVNNRLGLSTTGSFLRKDESSFAGIGFNNWTIADRGEPYTGIINLSGTRELTTLALSSTGEIIDTGQRTTTSDLLNVPFDLSEDGHWAISGGNLPIALFEVSEDGIVTLADIEEGPEPSAGSFGVRFFPDLSGIATIGYLDAMATIEFSESSLIGDTLDVEGVGIGAPEAMDINPAGDLILVDDQSGGGEFSLFTYHLASDGQLTPTGFSLAKSFKLGDIQFIPPLTPPTLPGDANLDGLVDTADLVFLINEALPDDKPILLPQNFANADIDGDIDVDQDDFGQILALILGL